MAVDADVDRYEDHPSTGVCKECGQLCAVLWEDMGIGPYEYWGCRGNDVQWCCFSECCEADVEFGP